MPPHGDRCAAGLPAGAFGVRCALCGDCFSAQMAREHNDANMLAMGARVIDEKLALQIVDTFLDTPFEGGRHERRVRKMMDIENK